MTPSSPLQHKGTVWRGVHFTLWKGERRLGPRERTLWRIALGRREFRLATQRNRWKRRIREVLRRREREILPGYLVTLKVHSLTERLSSAELEKEISELLQNSGLLRKGKDE